MSLKDDSEESEKKSQRRLLRRCLRCGTSVPLSMIKNKRLRKLVLQVRPLFNIFSIFPPSSELYMSKGYKSGNGDIGVYMFASMKDKKLYDGRQIRACELMRRAVSHDQNGELSKDDLDRLEAAIERRNQIKLRRVE